jgi:hypothetical protein
VNNFLLSVQIFKGRMGKENAVVVVVVVGRRRKGEFQTS